MSEFESESPSKIILSNKKAPPIPPKIATEEMDELNFSISRDDAEMASIWERFSEEFNSQDKANSSPLFLNDIDQPFDLGGVSLNDEYRMFDVEPLLDQAARLLDRGIADRTEWDEYREKTFKLKQELEEFHELDEVHRREEAAGFYSLPFERANEELYAEINERWGINSSLTNLNWLYENFYKGDKALDVAYHIQLAGWLSGFPNNDEFTWSGVTRRKAEHLKQVAVVRGFFNVASKINQLLSQISVQNGAISASDNRQNSLRRQKNWSREDIIFRKQRTQIARDSMMEKLRSSTDPNGALNYPVKMRPIQDRFLNDFEESVVRLLVVASGMKKLYGYTDPLPNSRRKFDGMVTWTRKASNWLVRFTRLAQNYVLPISARSLLTDKEWEAGRATGKWTFKVSESDIFPEQRHVRLRGISAYVSGQNLKGLWQFKIKAPPVSYCRHLNGKKIDLDQSGLPPCWIGRTTTRDHRRNPDVVAIAAWHNASPFGQWEVTISPESTDRISRNFINNFQIDMHVSVRHER